MTEHSSEPHSHTLTFTDNAGNAHSLEHDCPGHFDELRTKVTDTGADSVNDMHVDGDPVPFEGVANMLAVIGRLDMVGDSYRTEENLIKLMIAIGAADTGGEE